jgi:hypothetical protein
LSAKEVAVGDVWELRARLDFYPPLEAGEETIVTDALVRLLDEYECLVLDVSLDEMKSSA